MPKIKSISDIAEKWGRVTPQRSDDYQKGIQNPRKDWMTETANAEGNYKSAITKSLAEGRFGKGVRKAGSDKWRGKTLSKGVNRWGPGVQDAQLDYEQGFAPFRDVIQKTDIGVRYPKGDPRNIERVAKIAKALHDKKVSG